MCICAHGCPAPIRYTLFGCAQENFCLLQRLLLDSSTTTSIPPPLSHKQLVSPGTVCHRDLSQHAAVLPKFSHSTRSKSVPNRPRKADLKFSCISCSAGILGELLNKRISYPMTDSIWEWSPTNLVSVSGHTKEICVRNHIWIPRMLEYARSDD